ncbi:MULTISPECIES: hypothetical protein [Streptomycetaceae]|uniref:Uncharacterized protein n=1 Tax=Streptantibioticus cattleyicolor (strain ATCC 35852 / DSM 46488 / JCM 4925 / NBRC 14057 / NRRL 8057) TaxID=1003195 RepID=F8JT11_STREN|nr:MULTISPECIES: hypothetical protein [Streptomycetaceae]AEW92946.1 hypothetical protein SCATT_05750 [Streptantibioticus cattleyicolor NRRL 8057 = DSM 46488]MYS57693.1 hypothetical protein [Streptomyces sp. SID5468]CCB73307.1 protein of unknown function [Streptantibioticus cattleyicolor NRRL 8057 = DSM 46488]
MDARDRERASQALALKLAGVDWQTIATKLGYPDVADAVLAAGEIADEQYDGPPLDPERMLEALRYDRLQAALWGPAMKGDLAAVDRVLTIADRRQRIKRLHRRSDE